MQPIDESIWRHSMNFDSHPPPPMYDMDMYMDCHELVAAKFGIDLQSEVSAENVVEIYDYLVANII